MDNDAVTIIRFAFSTQAIRSAKSYLPQTDNLGHAKKKKGRDTTCGVWTTSSACQLRAWGEVANIQRETNSSVPSRVGRPFGRADLLVQLVEGRASFVGHPWPGVVLGLSKISRHCSSSCPCFTPGLEKRPGDADTDDENIDAFKP